MKNKLILIALIFWAIKSDAQKSFVLSAKTGTLYPLFLYNTDTWNLEEEEFSINTNFGFQAYLQTKIQFSKKSRIGFQFSYQKFPVEILHDKLRFKVLPTIYGYLRSNFDVNNLGFGAVYDFIYRKKWILNGGIVVNFPLSTPVHRGILDEGGVITKDIVYKKQKQWQINLGAEYLFFSTKKVDFSVEPGLSVFVTKDPKEIASNGQLRKGCFSLLVGVNFK